jgi:hypothetical protein
LGNNNILLIDSMLLLPIQPKLSLQNKIINSKKSENQKTKPISILVFFLYGPSLWFYNTHYKINFMVN